MEKKVDYLKQAIETGLMDIVMDQLGEHTISVSRLVEDFDIPLPYAQAIYDELVHRGLIQHSNGLRIILLDKNPKMIEAWEKEFKGLDDVEVVQSDLIRYLDLNHVDALTSPANGFGYMNGGFDLAITKYFGQDLQDAVLDYIRDHFYGEQPVGTSFCIDIPHHPMKLIHTPTMRLPSSIEGEDWIVYQCMRTTLMCALKQQIKSIIIPAFGGATGGLDYRVIAKRMKEGYVQIKKAKDGDPSLAKEIFSC